MSVPKGKQRESKKEYYDFAYKVMDNIDDFVTRDFGLKTRVRDLKSFTFRAKMNNEDKEQFNVLCDKYKIDVVAEYPLWKVERFRDKIENLTDDVLRYITLADSIYPQTMSEFNARRNWQWKAIGTCYFLLQTFQTLMRRLDVDVEKFMVHVDNLRREIYLLRQWKKSDNRFKAIILQREIEQEADKQRKVKEKL